jgi:4-amino-4-deoxy-L-arabinose transferase-like glycosyltransferase
VSFQLRKDWWLRAFVRGMIRTPGRHVRLSGDATRILVGLVLVGIAFRIVALIRWDIVYDGAVYAVMGNSLLQHGEFLVPAASAPTFYDQYPPLFPAYLAMFYSVLGFGANQTKIAEFVLSLLFIGTVHATSKDLLGRPRAWYVTAFVSLEPIFLITTSIGFSESLVGLVFVLTVWAIVRSLKDPRFMLLAGVCAGLGYLAKGSLGPLFLVAGLAGLAWRVRLGGLRVFRDPWYTSGIGVFVSVLGLWSLRDISRFGWPHWDTNSVVDSAYAYSLAHPGTFAIGLTMKVPWFLLIFAFYAGPFLPQLRIAWRRKAEGTAGALLLAVALVFVMGWIVSAAFWTVEGTPLWWTDNMRYVVIASPVLAWAGLRELPPLHGPRTRSLRRFRARYALWMVMFLFFAIVIAAFPAPYSQVAVAEELVAHVHPGDVVGVHALSLESVLPYVGVPGVQLVVYRSGFSGAYIISGDGSIFPGFVLVAYHDTVDLTGHAYISALWERQG